MDNMDIDMLLKDLSQTLSNYAFFWNLTEDEEMDIQSQNHSNVYSKSSYRNSSCTRTNPNTYNSIFLCFSSVHFQSHILNLFLEKQVTYSVTPDETF